MDIQSVTKLAKIIKQYDLTEIEWTEESTTVKLKKNLSGTVVSNISAIPVAAPQFAEAIPQQILASENASASTKEKSKSNYHEFTAPMVGTYYKAVSPNDPDFIKVGDEVKKGQSLCIIEAMKLMNEIESDVDGVVKAIHVNNEDPVEYGSLLFEIDTNG